LKVIDEQDSDVVRLIPLSQVDQHLVLVRPHDKRCAMRALANLKRSHDSVLRAPRFDQAGLSPRCCLEVPHRPAAGLRVSPPGQ
jgi:hypothetical protein